MISHPTRRSVLAWPFALGIVNLSNPAQAADWQPSKPVRIVVPIVGSTNDVIARLVAPELHKALGQPTFVDNKGGAGGSIGTLDAIRSPADGHTLLVGFNGPIAINPTLMPKLAYDPRRDLQPVTLAVTSPQFLVVNSSLPVKTVAELVALAKRKNLSYASVSVGSASHLTMEMLKTAARVDVAHIPYKGAAPAVADLVGGQVDAAFLVPGNVQQFVKDGKLRILASTGERRFSSTPQVPTMIEQGYPGFLALSWVGFFLSAQTPKPIVERYQKVLVDILRQPEIRTKLEQMDFDVMAGTSAQFADWINVEIARWGKVIRDNRITAD